MWRSLGASHGWSAGAKQLRQLAVVIECTPTTCCIRGRKRPRRKSMFHGQCTSEDTTMSAIKKAALSGTTLVIQRRCRKIPAAEKYSKHHCLLVCLVQNGAIGRQNVGDKTEDGGGRRGLAESITRESTVLCLRKKQIGLVATESTEKQRRPPEQAKSRQELLRRRL